jgi:hypothetical protein
MELSHEVLDGDREPNQHSVGRLMTSAECVVDAAKRLVVVRFGKKVIARDIERYAAMLRANPSFQPSFSEIADMSDVEELDLQADDFLRLADEIDPFSTEAKRAFVAVNSVQNHAARMHKILRTQRNIEIFASFEEAERWIQT